MVSFVVHTEHLSTGPGGGAGWKGLRMAAATAGEAVTPLCRGDLLQKGSLTTVSTTDPVCSDEERPGNEKCTFLWFYNQRSAQVK